ncbi:MAG: VWA domain-containing protein [Planctomycetes bacterium]|nr:VWA domain-containing protein [Planctomycetota bacterium]
MQALLLSLAFFTAEPTDPPLFLRGDVDGDLRYAFRDAIRLLDFQFAEGPTPPCLDAADFDDDGTITLGDAVGLLLFLFAGGSEPAPPVFACGPDPTPDDLGCELGSLCGGGTITVRGRSFEGGAFFFCLDRNSSMSWTCRGKVKLDYAKEWLIEAIGALSSDMDFGIVAYNSGIICLSEHPLRATDHTKAQAIDWVRALYTMADACLGPAGIRTVSMAMEGNAKTSRIFIITDGMPGCNGRFTQSECLRDITAANVRRIPIDTLFIPDDGTWEDPEFLEQLSAANQGASYQIAP